MQQQLISNEACPTTRIDTRASGLLLNQQTGRVSLLTCVFQEAQELLIEEGSIAGFAFPAECDANVRKLHSRDSKAYSCVRQVPAQRAELT
jgi:hypothetical protein